MALGNEPAREALVETAIGSASGPYAMGGDILVAWPTERRTEVPTGQVLDRLRVDAFAAWLAAAMADLEVTLDADPFGAGSAAASPSPGTSGQAVPTVAPMATPPVVVLPGASGS